MLGREPAAAISLAEIFSEETQRPGFRFCWFQNWKNKNNGPAREKADMVEYLSASSSARHSENREYIAQTTLLLDDTVSGHKIIDAIEDRDMPLFIGNMRSSVNKAYSKYDVTTQKAQMFVSLARQSSLYVGASLLCEELRHINQFENIYNRPSGRLFRERGWIDGGTDCDNIFIGLIKEGDAFTHRAINAYEFHEKGINDSIDDLRLFDKKFGTRFIESLFDLANGGLDLHSDEMKRTLFNAWMTTPFGMRHIYEAEEVSSHYDEAKARVSVKQPGWTSGITVKNKDLICIAAEKDGASYLDGIDLVNDKYTQRLSQITVDETGQPNLEDVYMSLRELLQQVLVRSPSNKINASGSAYGV